MNETLLESLPVWAAVPAAVLLILSGIMALIGSLGLLRLPDFYSRVHAPTLSATLGAILTVGASMLVAIGHGHRAVFHEVLILGFLMITSPVTAMLLMRAVRYRRNRLVTPPPKKAEKAAEKPPEVSDTRS